MSSHSLYPRIDGISGAYQGNDPTWRLVIAFFCGITTYNALELIVLIFVSFTKYRGLYFWSLLVASIGLIPYAFGISFKFLGVIKGEEGTFICVALLTVGWWAFLTGSNVVLWSRLHLIVHGERGDRILKYTKWMIIGGFVFFHIPTTVVTFGSNGTLSTEGFVKAYNVIERYQMTGFFLEEIILSTVYINETVKILRQSLRPETKRLMYQLIFINILIILMDMSLLAIEYASLYMLEATVKGFTYSVKLKLEFAILSRLVSFVGGHQERRGSVLTARTRSMTFVDAEKANSAAVQRRETRTDSSISEFVDLSKATTDYRYAVATKAPKFARHDEGDIEDIEVWEHNVKE